jgi:hypothetical protein
MTSSIHFKTKYPLILYSLENDTLPQLLKVERRQGDKLEIKDFKDMIKGFDLKEVYGLYKREFPSIPFLTMCHTYLHLHKKDFIVDIEADLNVNFIEQLFTTDFINKLIREDIAQEGSVIITDDEREIILKIKPYEAPQYIDHLSQEIKRFQDEYTNNDFISLLVDINNTILLIPDIYKLLTSKLSLNFTKKLEEIRFVCDNEIDLNEIFDKIKLDQYFPFCMFKTFIKVIEGFDEKLTRDWMKFNYDQLSLGQLHELIKERKLQPMYNLRKGQIILNLIKNDNENNNVLYERDVIVLKFLKVLDNRKRVVAEQSGNTYSDVKIYTQNDSLLVDVITDKKTEFLQQFTRISDKSIRLTTTKVLSFSGEFIFTIDMFSSLVEEKNFYLHLTLFSYLLLDLQYIIIINEFSNSSTTNELLKLKFLPHKKLSCTIRNGKKKDGSRVIFATISNCENEEIRDDFLTHLWILMTMYFRRKEELFEKHRQYYPRSGDWKVFKNRFTKFSNIENKQNLSIKFVSLYNSRNPNKPSLHYTTNVQPPPRWHCIKIREIGNNIEDLTHVWEWSKYFFESSKKFSEDNPDFVFTKILEKHGVDSIQLETVKQFAKGMRVFINDTEYTITKITDNIVTLDKSLGEDVLKDNIIYRKIQYMIWPRLPDKINYSISNIKNELSKEGALVLFADTINILSAKKYFFLNLAKPNYVPAGTEISPIFHKVQGDADNEIKEYFLGDIKETSSANKIPIEKSAPDLLLLLQQNILLDNKDAESSFYSCVVKCLNGNDLLKSHTTDEEHVKKCFIMSKSSLYDVFENTEEFYIKLKSSQYDRAEYLTTFLEYAYNIYIITIKKNNEMVVPRHQFGYIDYSHQDRPFIFIYEDDSKKPYKFFRQKKPKSSLVWDVSNPLHRKGINFLLKTRFNGYHLSNRLFPFVNFSEDVFTLIDSQFIDEFGKCRVVLFKIDGVSIFAQTFIPPIPIHYKKTLTTGIVKPIDYETFDKVRNRLNLTLTKQCLLKEKIDDFLVECYCEIPITNENQQPIPLIFKIKRKKIKFAGIQVYKTEQIISHKEVTSEYDTFNNNKKIAEILLECLLWLYSTVTKGKLDMKVEDFIKNYTEVVVGVVYDISKMRTTRIDNSNDFIKGNKLQISSDVKKRLSFHLTLNLRRQHSYMKNLWKSKVLKSLYSDVSDFKSHKGVGVYHFNNIYSRKSYTFLPTLGSFNVKPFFTFDTGNQIVLAHDIYNNENADLIELDSCSQGSRLSINWQYPFIRPIKEFEWGFNLLKKFSNFIRGNGLIYDYLFAETENSGLPIHVMYIRLDENQSPITTILLDLKQQQYIEHVKHYYEHFINYYKLDTEMSKRTTQQSFIDLEDSLKLSTTYSLLIQPTQNHPEGILKAFFKSL